ncbi:uncharacterized protein LOC6565423 [Drosophila grimshawi]|uniref:uncharacterized protein LOC6565423 n=1 Tax=Drosophila grimshawi TaxID=7222 RepID=UPI000C86ED64|nr:uncharacterized protein LOC6565423 [Drosophila grimshawi]
MNPINNKLPPIGSERAERLTAMQAPNPNMPLLQQQQRHVNHLSDEDKAWLRSKRELQFEWEHQQQFEKYWKLNNHEGREEETEETQRFGGKIPEATHINRMPNQQLEMAPQAPQAPQAVPFGFYMVSPQIWLHPGYGHAYNWNLWQPPNYNHYTNYVAYENIHFPNFYENQGNFDNPGAYFPHFQ